MIGLSAFFADRPLFDALIYLARTGMQWAVLRTRSHPSQQCLTAYKNGSSTVAWKQLGRLLLADYDETLGMAWQWQAADGCIIKAPLHG